ncbi:MAG: helix-turn-helix transcriptional regulator [Oscillospiraceae bacterium]|nr:helix-turn-helix transcriptional regulator [Oscillospiraceae bacterium]
MRFGEKLRKARTEKGMTQAGLAQAAGLSTRTIIYYEQGKTYPQDRDVYRRLAGILNVDADYLHNENDDFLARAMAEGGTRTRRQAEELLGDINGLFAGGDMADEDMDEFMRAVQECFWKAKEKNRQKYGKKAGQKE